MASFDENGKYIKTNWKAGDKITATKLNKIEESIEAVNDNDISRHVEADARLDALEAKDAAHDKEFTNVKNLIEDAKDAAELGDYEINSRMTFLENELNEGIEEVHNVASTVDGKIATAQANMTAQVNTAKGEMATQVNQGKADMEAMVAEVNTNVDNKLSAFATEVNSSITSGDATLQGNIDTLQANLEAADATLQNDIDERLPLSGGTITGSVQLDISEAERSIDFVSNNQILTFWYGVDNLEEASGPRMGWYDRVNERHIMYYDTANVTSGIPCPLYINANLIPRFNHTIHLGSTENRWRTLYLSDQIKINNLNIRVSDSKLTIDGFTGSNDNPNFVIDNTSTVYARGVRPQYNASNDLGNDSLRWRHIFLNNNPNVSSDRSLKENIEYVGKAKSGLTYEELYNFVKDDLGLATYNFIGQDKLQMNFIAQDLLVNEDGTDNKVGQMIINPVPVPTEEEIAEGKPYPTLNYDMGMYISVLAGALKESINKIEQLEARINELENK